MSITDLHPIDAAAVEKQAGPNPARSANDIVLKALEDDKREGLILAVRARWAGLAVIAPLLIFLNQDWSVVYYLALLCGFALIGWAQLRIGRVGRSRAELALLFCDLALLTFTLLFPNPLDDRTLPLAVQYQFGGFIYFFFLLAGATLAYSWRTLVAMGAWTSVIWLIGFLMVWMQPVAFPELTSAIQAALPDHPDLWEFSDPNNLRFDGRMQEVVVFVIVAATLAISGWRAQQLLLHHASVERQRANLVRYFSPNVVEELANNDEPLKQIRTQDVAVLFVDIVGFTTYAENRPPSEVIQTLREFHGLMETQVFKHSGTLDKYLGDGLMATFGTPSPTTSDAGNALKCARAMIGTVETWGQDRKARGEVPLRVGFGVHFGPAVLGDIGANRLEFAVIGSTVNIASRLEALTRKLDVSLVASDAIIIRAGAEPGHSDADLAGLQRKPAQSVPGLAKAIKVWTLGVNG